MAVRNTLRRVLLPMAQLVGRVRERRWRGVRFLCYHSVGTPEDVPRLEARTLAMSIAAFSGHLELMRTTGYQVVSMARALELAASGAATGQYVCFTFDDGRIDNFTIVWPLLRDAGYTAHFFVSSALVGSSVRCNGTDDRYMDADALRTIASEGGSIGSHARHHDDLTLVDDDRLRDELHGSRRELEDITGLPITTLAYPYASYDRRVVTATRAAGYSYAFGISTGAVASLAEPLAIPRNVMRSGIDASENDAILRGGMDFTRPYSAFKSRLRLRA
jgi:peptidoglycan/xylan/chitin deacetylase (PgdA/CDA1 family)